jgi:hypothetical protein
MLLAEKKTKRGLHPGFSEDTFWSDGNTEIPSHNEIEKLLLFLLISDSALGTLTWRLWSTILQL